MAKALTVVVERDGEEPVYAQIARQIRDHVGAGDLVPDQALPAVRSLASDLGVNLNTVARAYRLLEEEGFVRIGERSGARVQAPARGVGAGARGRLARELRALLQRMRQAGFAGREIHALVARELGDPGGAP